jgi:hypothetical protein
MKLLHATKIATLASLLALSNISCAADPIKEPNKPPAEYPRGEDKTPAPAASFNISKDGRFIPVNKDGKEFVQCSGDKNSKNTCAIYNNKVTVKELKNIVITKMVYSVNPTCVIYCMDFGDGFPSCYTDPTDPNCAKFN